MVSGSHFFPKAPFSWRKSRPDSRAESRKRTGSAEDTFSGEGAREVGEAVEREAGTSEAGPQSVRASPAARNRNRLALPIHPPRAPTTRRHHSMGKKWNGASGRSVTQRGGPPRNRLTTRSRRRALRLKFPWAQRAHPSKVWCWVRKAQSRVLYQSLNRQQ